MNADKSLKAAIQEAVQAAQKTRRHQAQLKKIKSFILSKYSNLYTQKSSLTKARQAFKQAGINDNDNILSLSQKVYAKMNKDYTQKVNNKALNLTLISKDQAQAIINKAVNLLSSPYFFERLAAVLLLTGRREIEICKTGKFVKVANQDYVRFLGIAKKKDDAKGRCKIWLLGSDLDTIKKVTKEVQKKYQDKTFTQVNSLVSANLKKAIEKNFNDLHLEKFNGHELRKFYAACIKDKFPLSNPNLLISSVLGHSKDDIKAALSYEKYIIK